MIKAGTGVASRAVTTFIAVRISATQERKHLEREIASKMEEFREPEDDRAHAVAAQFAESFLVVDRGEGLEKERVFLPPGCRVTLGRSPECDIVVNATLVRRTHFMFTSADSKVWMDPLAPINPIRVNGGIVSQPTQLNSDDEITIDGVPSLTITFKALR